MLDKEKKFTITIAFAGFSLKQATIFNQKQYVAVQNFLFLTQEFVKLYLHSIGCFSGNTFVLCCPTLLSKSPEPPPISF